MVEGRYNVDIEDVPDILDTKLDIIVISSGSSGFMVTVHREEALSLRN